MGSLIFLMQAGFFLLEGGQVRSRDVTNVMMKMTGHLGLGILIFLLCGFAIKQYGWPLAALPNGWRYPWQFVGDGGHSISFYVSLMFALVSCAIPSGCFSGRMKFSAYLLFAVSTWESFIPSSPTFCGMARSPGWACRITPAHWACMPSAESSA